MISISDLARALWDPELDARASRAADVMMPDLREQLAEILADEGHDVVMDGATIKPVPSPTLLGTVQKGCA